MAVAIECEKCGKRYSVNETVLGKRVACKQCSQPFVAKLASPNPIPASVAPAAVKPKAVAPRAVTPKPATASPGTVTKKVLPARPIEPEVIQFAGESDDWSAIEAAAGSNGVVEAPVTTAAVKRSGSVGNPAGPISEFLCRYSAGTITRVSAVVVALLFVLATLVTAMAQPVGMAFFFVGSFAYFIVGLCVIVIRGLRAEGEQRISPGAVIALVFSVILSVLARRAVVFRRGRRSGGIPAGTILRLFGNAVFIFLMTIVIGVLPLALGNHRAVPPPFAFSRQPTFPTVGPSMPSMPSMPSFTRPVPLSQRFSADQITKVIISGLSDRDAQGSWLFKHLGQICNSTSLQGERMDGTATYSVELVTDLDLGKVAGRIDFGTATVDAPTRTIRVATDMAKLDGLLAADPSYHPGNEKPNPSPTPADAAPVVPASPAHPIPDNEATPKKPMPDLAEPGMKVLVHWGSSWWPATVVRMEGNKYRIHYDGWNEASDETVDSDRIQPAK